MVVVPRVHVDTSISEHTHNNNDIIYITRNFVLVAATRDFFLLASMATLSNKPLVGWSLTAYFID